MQRDLPPDLLDAIAVPTLDSDPSPAVDPIVILATDPIKALGLQRSTCHSRLPDRYGYSPDRYGCSHTSLLTMLSFVNIPNNFSQAIQHECWCQAMKKEFDALLANNTWDVVSCLSDIKPIGCKWV